jgi:hypothetical protein
LQQSGGGQTIVNREATMFRKRPVASLIAVCCVLLAVVAGTALAYQGTPQGKKLAGELLASYNHVHYLAGSVHGSVYYCPSAVGGYVEEGGGYLAPASCQKHPATASWVNTLRRDRGRSAVGQVTSKGEPSITFVAKGTTTFIRAKGATCWTQQSGNFFEGPLFSFFSDEYMTVGKKRGKTIQLIGTSSDFNGFKEIDTLNSKSHQMIGESIYFGRKHKSTEVHLLTSYHQAKRAPMVPHTSPVCQG